MRIPFLRVAAGILVATLSGLALSQSVGLGDLDFEDLLNVRVTSASRYAQPVREAPSAVEVITREDIRRHGWRTLAEALDSLTGVYATSDRAYSYVGARGFLIPGDYNSRFLLMIDGQRTNDNIYEQASFSEEFSLDLALVERIEYVPGPGSSIYGSNAIFGVINVITRRAAELPPLQLALMGAQDRWLEGRATGAMRLENGATLVLSATGGRKGGRDQTYYDPAGSLIELGGPSPDAIANDLDHMRKRQLFGRYEDGPFAFAVRHADRRVRPSSALYSTLFDDAGLVVEDGITSLLARYHRQASEHLGIEARVEYGEMIYRADYPYDEIGDGTGARYLNRDDSLGRWWAGEFRAFYTGLSGHKIVAGIEGQRDVRARQVNENVDGAFAGTLVDVDNRRHRVGVYAQDEWAFAERWRLSVGVRHDDFSSGEASTNPRLGLIWLPGQATTVKLLAGRAFRVPNSYERDFGNGTTYLANPDLAPEKIRTVEAVVEHQVTPMQNLRFAAYENRIDNLIAQEDVAGQLQYLNQRPVTASGAEAAWRVRGTSGWALQASVAYSDVEYDDDRRPGYSPRWVGKLRGSLPVFGERWMLSADGRVNSATTYAWGGDPYRLPTRLLVDFALTGARIAPGFDGLLRVRNAFDRRLAFPSSEEVAVPTVPDIRRTIEAAVTYSF